MQVEIKIDKESIEKQICESIINSSIGEEIQKSIDTALTEKNGNWGNQKTIIERAVDDAVEKKIRSIVAGLIESKTEEIRAKMVERMTDEVISNMCSATFDVLEEKLKR